MSQQEVKHLFVTKNPQLLHQCESDKKEGEIIKMVKRERFNHMCEFMECVDYPQYVVVKFTVKNHRGINYYCDKHYIRNVTKAFRDGYEAVKVYCIDKVE